MNELKSPSKLILVLLFSLLFLSFGTFNIPKVKATETFTSQSSDGDVSLLASPTYGDARNASAGIVYDSLDYLEVGQWFDGGFDYKVCRGFVFFDTSNIFATANITSAILSLHIKTSSTTVDFNVTIQDGSPYYPHQPMVSGDYYHNHYSDNGGSRNTSEIASLSYWNISLNSQGIGWINREGITKLCLRSSNDINNIAPTTSPESIEIYTFEKGLDYAPKLHVIYEAYSYTFHGLFDENSGLLKTESERAVNVTVYYTNASASTTFEVNGTYIFNTSDIPLYFHIELGSSDREYWLSEEEVNINIYIFNQTLTTYTITFLDLAGVLDDNPIVKAQRYINGTLMTVEKRKVDAENKLQFSLIQGCKYTIIIQDGATYTFGDLLMTSTTTIQLTLKGIEFPKETLLTYKYVRIYGTRAFATPNGTITITYQDTLNMTASVKIYIKYKNGTNVYTYTFYNSTFNLEWANALNNTDYRVVCTIDHATYGVYSWKQYFPCTHSTMPWSLDWLGKSLPFDTAYIIPALLILFAGGCFSKINAETGAFMMVITAIILSYLGWIPIPANVLVVAFTFALLMGIIYVKRGRVQT